ncbi:MAG: peptide ABC transporter substrate-binding protein [Gemmatimonadetes bacterium]|nr:peptide ABC transporter substrate-binding protein [Gemmatimonadota bacterium]
MFKSRGRYLAESRLLLGLCLGALSCGTGTEQASDAVLFASGADLQSINPLIAVHPLAKQVQKNVLFVTLVAYDSAMRPVPRLATPEWSAGRRALTFRLRHDVSWHDGSLTTAEDVRWTLEMARNPAVAYPRSRELEAVAAVEASDSFTVRVTFSRSQPVFPDVFTDLAILPAHRFRGVAPAGIRTAPFNRAPVGNGPFEFSEYQPGQRWVFRRSQRFPAELGRPSIGRLVIVVVDEPATKLAGLTSGELDFAGIAAAHAEIVRKNPRLRVIDYPIMLANAVIWNLRRAPFDDPGVRRALDLAIDRQLIVDGFIHGFGSVAAGPVPPEHPWYEPVAPPPHDTVQANRLLSEAGWTRGPDGVRQRGGRRLAFDLLTVGSGDNIMEQMLQAQLKAVGVEIRIRQLELSTFLSVLQGSARDFDGAVTGIVGDLALGYVGALLGSREGNALAYPGYASEEFAAALNRARTATTESALIAAWRDAQRILARDRPVSWLYHSRGVQGVSRRVGNVVIDLRGELAGVARWTLAGQGSAR